MYDGRACKRFSSRDCLILTDKCTFSWTKSVRFHWSQSVEAEKDLLRNHFCKCRRWGNSWSKIHLEMPLPRPDTSHTTQASNRGKVQSVLDVIWKYCHKGTGKCTKWSKHNRGFTTGWGGQFQSPRAKGKKRLRKKLWLKNLKWSRWRIFWQIFFLTLFWRIQFSSKWLSTNTSDVSKNPQTATRLNFLIVTKDTSATLCSLSWLLVLHTSASNLKCCEFHDDDLML